MRGREGRGGGGGGRVSESESESTVRSMTSLLFAVDVVALFVVSSDESIVSQSF